MGATRLAGNVALRERLEFRDHFMLGVTKAFQISKDSPSK